MHRAYRHQGSLKGRFLALARCRSPMAGSARVASLGALLALARVVSLGALLGFATHAAAQQADEPRDASEESIKAAYLYRFADYVEWPETRSAGTRFTIGVLGAPALADELAGMTAGARADGRAVRVQRLEAEDSLEDLDVLFVGARERGRLAELLAPVRGLPVLTVTESDDALREGSIINFTIRDRNVRFEVGLDTAVESGLKLNSRLLAVAERVVQTPE